MRTMEVMETMEAWAKMAIMEISFWNGSGKTGVNAREERKVDSHQKPLVNEGKDEGAGRKELIERAQSDHPTPHSILSRASKVKTKKRTRKKEKAREKRTKKRKTRRQREGLMMRLTKKEPAGWD